MHLHGFDYTRLATLVIHSCDSGIHSYDSGIHSYDSGIHSYDSGIHSYDSGIHSYDSGIHSYDSGIHSYDSYPIILVSIYINARYIQVAPFPTSPDTRLPSPRPTLLQHGQEPQHSPRPSKSPLFIGIIIIFTTGKTDKNTNSPINTV
ncbi:hypothetical protein IAQ61_006303 [Plenodomus lingam]|uniref:uncharacterized protein n=1 Tax=Leptosphaeria maculans TaxID=5022 RepID=UPI003326F56A|nr:hypothetical protein IAQ61_006303 [Plenodomus lingam]